MRASSFQPGSIVPPARAHSGDVGWDGAGDGDERAALVGDGLAAIAVVLAGLTGVVLFLPAAGFIATPLHDALTALLGRSTFVLPLLLLLGGVLRLAHVPLPRARLIGLGCLFLAVLASQHLLVAGDAGVAGRWLGSVLVDALGGLGTAVVLLAALALGGLLTFGVPIGRR
ncbi:MAG TPA: hypothetical protein VGL99_05015 [Chloroflexota bacterium]|jgi:hypothetical protein